MRTLPSFLRATQLTCGLGVLFATVSLAAQPLTDGFSKEKGTGDVFLSYSWERYDMFYNGDTKGDAPPQFGGEITTQSVGLYAVYGITDDLNVIASLPYIAAKGAGDTSADDAPSQEANGLQDVELMLKYRFLTKESEQGKFSLLGAASFSAPITDYEANEVISIGNHAAAGNVHLIAHYISAPGIFGEVQAGYSLRGKDGDNEVPNAALLSAKVGYAGSQIYVDGWVRSQVSASDAPDIGMMTPFSTTRVNYTQIGVSAFRSVGAGIGLSLGVAQYVTGRNVGLATRVSGGIGYSF